MPNRRLMDYMMRRDGRNPYGSAGGYITSSRRRARRDRAYGNDMAGRNDYAEYNNRQPNMDYSNNYPRYDMAYEQPRQSNRDYGYDGHQEGKTYYPIEAMGRFNGYWGMPQQDYRGGRDYGYDYNYDMRGRSRDYGYYDMAGDYGENLTKEEIDHWKSKLLKEVDEKDKPFFNKETFNQRAKSMGIQMGENFTEDELCLTTLMMLTDYKKTLGTANMDIYVRLAKDWLEDKDVSVKGGEKLAVYHDCIVEGEDD